MTDNSARLLPRRPGNARGRATLERLSTAALEVAERRGVEGTTVDDICRLAGCSRRTFFHHFPSRDAALLGPAVPTVPPEAVARYLRDPVPILAGALELVDLPFDLGPSTALGARRHALLRASPRLQAAARDRMTPAASAVLAAVTAKIAQQPGLDPVALPQMSQAVTAIVAALIETAFTTGTNDPVATLDSLTPLWHQLIG